MQVIGKVVSLELDTMIEGKSKTYPGFELVYRDKKSGEVKSLAKHANTLKYNKPLKNGLESLAVGDVFTMGLKKNDQGYWEPESIVKGEVAATTPEAPKGTASRPQTGGGGNTYPTADERAQTQIHIIRQNCVTNAVNFVIGSGVKKDMTPENVLSVAKVFEKFVHTGETLSEEDQAESTIDSGVE